jgi:hypothetical protein
VRRVLVIVVVVAIGLVGAFIWHITRPDHVVHLVAATIHIGPDETFAPPPASPTPRLTFDQVWTRNGGRHLHLPWPVGSPTPLVYLGELTLPSGRTTLAYAIASPGVCGGHTLPGPTPAGHCTFWMFYDANTGYNVEGTTQYG